jgi:uncharacterized membrane protein YoaK (UPF0700 family)
MLLLRRLTDNRHLMDGTQLIRLTTFLLAFAAGYCDTCTFVAANEVFSAHVTGNFIVLAYDLVNHANLGAWIKLLTLPVFIIAVSAGGWIGRTTKKTHSLTIIEGGLLLVAGISAYALRPFYHPGLDSFPVMLVVFAMGLQNAFGKLFVKETLGPTTMMTGNVTQLALDLSQSLHTGFADPAALAGLKRQLVNISSFLAGCIAGGLLAKPFGVAAVVVPGLVVLFFGIWRNSKPVI